MSKPTDLVQGTLDLLILKVVALEPMHGWAIAQRIRQMSSDVLQVGQSALYPALHKLERQGHITSDVEDLGNEPPRALLLAHPHRPQSRGRRNGQLGTIVGRHLGIVRAV